MSSVTGGGASNRLPPESVPRVKPTKSERQVGKGLGSHRVTPKESEKAQAQMQPEALISQQAENKEVAKSFVVKKTPTISCQKELQNLSKGTITQQQYVMLEGKLKGSGIDISKNMPVQDTRNAILLAVEKLKPLKTMVKLEEDLKKIWGETDQLKGLNPKSIMIGAKTQQPKAETAAPAPARPVSERSAMSKTSYSDEIGQMADAGVFGEKHLQAKAGILGFLRHEPEAVKHDVAATKREVFLARRDVKDVKERLESLVDKLGASFDKADKAAIRARMDEYWAKPENQQRLQASKKEQARESQRQKPLPTPPSTPRSSAALSPPPTPAVSKPLSASQEIEKPTYQKSTTFPALLTFLESKGILEDTKTLDNLMNVEYDPDQTYSLNELREGIINNLSGAYPLGLDDALKEFDEQTISAEKPEEATEEVATDTSETSAPASPRINTSYDVIVGYLDAEGVISTEDGDDIIQELEKSTNTDEKMNIDDLQSGIYKVCQKLGFSQSTSDAILEAISNYKPFTMPTIQAAASKESLNLSKTVINGVIEKAYNEGKLTYAQAKELATDLFTDKFTKTEIAAKNKIIREIEKNARLDDNWKGVAGKLK